MFSTLCVVAKSHKDSSDIFLLQEENGYSEEVMRRVVDGNILMRNSINQNIGNIIKNGVRFIHNSGKNSTYVGIRAGRFNSAEENTGFGAEALRGTMRDDRNVAVGSFALTKNNQGSSNIAIGNAALTSQIDGFSSIAIGKSALSSYIRGAYNIAIGRNALLMCTSTDNLVQSIAIGNSALAMATDPLNTRNVVIGARALQTLTSGSHNVVVGTNAMGLAPFSSRNTVIGVQGGGSAGNDNVTIGFQAGSKINGDNNIMIGNVGVTGDSNTIRIGSGQTRTFIAGILGAIVSGAPVYVTSDGQLGIKASSRKYKHGICTMSEDDSKSIYRLDPVTFMYHDDETETMHYGLIAEEVDKVFPELVIRDEYNEPFSVRYEVLPVLLLNEIKQLKQKRENLPLLKTIVKELKEKLDRFMAS